MQGLLHMVTQHYWLTSKFSLVYVRYAVVSIL